MATAVRQRVPFRFSEEDDLHAHVLDEQEQEEILYHLRKQNQTSDGIYYIGLQLVVSLSLLIHVIFTFSSPKVSPLAAVFPDSPSKPVPFVYALLLLQYTVHANLFLYCLPLKHHIRQMIPNASLPRSVSLPLSLYHPASIILPMIAPAYALFLGCGKADVLWWSSAALLTLIVGLAIKWMRDTEKDVEQLEKLRYTARGA